MKDENIIRKVKTGFISGAVFCAIALCCSPISIGQFALAVVSGFVAGYIGYDFRGILKKIPVAWNQTKFIMAQRGYPYFNKTKLWISKEHPGVYLTLLLWSIFMLFFYKMSEVIIFVLGTPGPLFSDPVIGKILFLGIPLAFGVFSLMLIQCFTMAACNIYWTNSSNIRVHVFYSGDGIIEVPFTYKNFFWALGFTALFAIRGICKSFVKMIFVDIPAKFMGALRFIKFIFIFAVTFPKRLIILIHSHERMSSAMLGVIGAMLFVNFAPQAITPLQYSFRIFCGGMCGAGLVVFTNLLFAKLAKRWKTADSRVEA